VLTAVAGAAGGGVDTAAPTSNVADGIGDAVGVVVAFGVGSGRLGSPDALGVLDAPGVAPGDVAGVAAGGGVCACDAVTPNAPTAPAAPIDSATSFVLSFMGHLLRTREGSSVRFPSGRRRNLRVRVTDPEIG